jgi:DNA-binding response OmpR family regulator
VNLCSCPTTGYDIILASDGSFAPFPKDDFQEKVDGEKASTLTRVLVVDDERLIADTVAAILNLHGYDAFTAYSPNDALKLSERFRPDVLLTDVMMPDMNGIDLARKMMTMLPAMKVLLFSGQAGTNALLDRTSLDDSSFSIVAKPIHPAKLVDAVRNLRT